MSNHKEHKEHIVRSAIVTAFTIAVALIWRDVIISAIEAFFPAKDELYAQFMTAIIATIVVIIAIKIFVRTEEKAEEMMEHMFERHEHPREEQHPHER